VSSSFVQLRRRGKRKERNANGRKNRAGRLRGGHSIRRPTIRHLSGDIG